jgi:hypothetical protein
LFTNVRPQGTYSVFSVIGPSTRTTSKYDLPDLREHSNAIPRDPSHFRYGS